MDSTDKPRVAVLDRSRFHAGAAKLIDARMVPEAAPAPRPLRGKGGVVLVRLPEQHMAAYMHGRQHDPRVKVGTYVSRSRNYVAEARAKKAAALAAQAAQ